MDKHNYLKIMGDKSKYILLFLLLFFNNPSFGQIRSTQDSLCSDIKSLSWNSFEITTTYFPQIVLKKKAKNIEHCNCKEKIVPCLLEGMDSSSKTVITHILLTKLFEPSNVQLEYKYIYSKDSTVMGVNFIFNRLRWQWNSETGNTIKTDEISRIKKYWTEKLISFEPH